MRHGLEAMLEGRERRWRSKREKSDRKFFSLLHQRVFSTHTDSKRKLDLETRRARKKKMFFVQNDTKCK